MKKFKLIKEYPGVIGSLGIIATQSNFNEYTATLKNPTSDNVIFSKEYIEKYPEYWEEIIEKKFQILKVGHLIDMQFEYNNGHYSLIKDNTLTIYSVQRLPDGEIFSIGDIVQHCTQTIDEITSINLVDGKIYFSTKEHPNKMSMGLGLVEKYKEPLFTTDDGVEIFEGDEYWFIMDNEVHHIVEANKNDDMKIDGYPDFSTEEEAKEHLSLFNDKNLSLNDVFKNIPKLSDRLKDILITFVKENR